MSNMQQKTTGGTESQGVKDGEILIQKQKDGNWKAYMLRDKQLLTVREIDPYTCLTKILTHP